MRINHFWRAAVRHLGREAHFPFDRMSPVRIGVVVVSVGSANGRSCSVLHPLVYLAMEAGYFEKVEELCNRYSLKCFMNFKESDSSLLHHRYLNLHELCIEDVCWVDEVNSLRDAICHFEECKVVGVDCEWKPNYEKGSRPNKQNTVNCQQLNMGLL